MRWILAGGTILVRLCFAFGSQINAMIRLFLRQMNAVLVPTITYTEHSEPTIQHTRMLLAATRFVLSCQTRQ